MLEKKILTVLLHYAALTNINADLMFTQTESSIKSLLNDLWLLGTAGKYTLLMASFCSAANSHESLNVDRKCQLQNIVLCDATAEGQ